MHRKILGVCYDLDIYELTAVDPEDWELVKRKEQVLIRKLVEYVTKTESYPLLRLLSGEDGKAISG